MVIDKNNFRCFIKLVSTNKLPHQLDTTGNKLSFNKINIHSGFLHDHLPHKIQHIQTKIFTLIS